MGRSAPGYQLVYLGIMGPQDGVDQALADLGLAAARDGARLVAESPLGHRPHQPPARRRVVRRPVDDYGSDPVREASSADRTGLAARMREAAFEMLATIIERV